MEQRLLWIDDQVHKFDPWISTFEKHGVTVDTGRSIDEAYQKVEHNAYDAIFVDAIMPGGSGTEALPRLATRAKDASLFVCSAYFYLDAVMEAVESREKEIDCQIRRIDKTNLPFTDDQDEIRQFLDEIFCKPVELDNRRQKAEAVLLNDDSPIRISWEEFSNLDMPGKLEITSAVAAWTQQARTTYFAQGFGYLVFCGDWNRPFITKRSPRHALAEEALLTIARQTQQAPFVFAHAGVLDDLSGSCSAVAGLRGYPVLRMEHHGDEHVAHLDSGNAYSLLSHEWYTEKGWIDRIIFGQVIEIGEMALVGKFQAIPDVIFTDAALDTRLGNLNVFSVLNWSSYRVAARCGPDCSQGLSEFGIENLCRFRTALLGRSLADDLDCDFDMSLRTGHVRFRGGR